MVGAFNGQCDFVSIIDRIGVARKGSVDAALSRWRCARNEDKGKKIFNEYTLINNLEQLIHSLKFKKNLS